MKSTTATLVLAAALTVAGCGTDGTSAPTTTAAASPGTTTLPACTPVARTTSITLVAYDSFDTSGGLGEALAEFTTCSGIGVTVVKAGDAGTMVTKATLTAGNPEGDVMWGVDNTLLSAALDSDVFEPYTSPELPKVPAALAALAPGGEVTPVDFGDVCVNYDISWFDAHGIKPPTTLDDLIDPAYKGLLVVEDPNASSPGLAFLLATIATYGEQSGGTGGWQGWWKALRANGVTVAPSWDSAYYEEFSGAGGSTGDHPLVVSYGSSPPVEVLFADPPTDVAPTGVSAGTCFRQVEFAGVLRGSKHLAEARQLIDFMLGDRFQRELPLSLFVYPARGDVALPDLFTRFAVVPDRSATVAPADIAANRTRWQDEWTQIVLR